MIFLRKLSVCFLNLLGIGISSNPKDFIIISLRHNATSGLLVKKEMQFLLTASLSISSCSICNITRILYYVKCSANISENCSNETLTLLKITLRNNPICMVSAAQSHPQAYRLSILLPEYGRSLPDIPVAYSPSASSSWSGCQLYPHIFP